MIWQPEAYSLALLGACAIYVLLGFYVLSGDARPLANRLLILMSGSMAVWAIALSFGGIAPDPEAAVVWRRVSAVGWTTLFAFLLHFVMALTERRRLLAAWLTYPVMYAPAAVSLYVFALRGELAAFHADVVPIATGWTAIASGTAANWMFFAYYAAAVVVSLALIVHWGEGSADPAVRATARMLTAAFLLALVLGSLSDRIANVVLAGVLPQTAPLVILVPVAAFVVAMRRFGLLAPPARRRSADEGRILSDEKRAQFYRHLSLAFVVGALLNVLHFHFFDASLGPVLWFSGALIVIGLALMVTPRLPGGRAHHDNVMMVMVALSIPLILFRFADEYAANIVWPVPLIFMSISAIFERRKMLFVLALTTVLTQLALWARVPELTIDVGAVDHASRLTLYGLAFVLAYYMNGVYVQRLAENEEQVGLQRTISRISAEFVTVSTANLPEKLSTLLAASGAACRADRAYLFLFDHEAGTMAVTDEWCAPGVEPGLPRDAEFPLEQFPWWMQQIERREVLHVADVATLPPEAAAEREVLEHQGIRSLLSVQVASGDRVFGFLGLDDVGSSPAWREEHHEMLRVLANLTSDALAKVEAEAEIHRMAYFDTVTGLPNRTMLVDRLERAIALAGRSETLVGVMLLDLDAFKAVNDTVGHEAGDELLRQLGARLAGRVRRYDTGARFGGDEFVIVVPQLAQAEDVHHVADHVMTAFAEPFVIQGQEFFVTASAGIAVYPVDGEDADALVKNADVAMYTAKARGKNQYACCSPALKDDVQRRMRLSNALYRAQERDELLLHYQPQVCIVSGRIVGAEALLRWRHPELGFVPPGVFIPLAEQTGLINAIGEWVLRAACRQSVAWRERGLPPMRMAVNLSVQQFRHPGLVGAVERALRDTGMRAEDLELEITESTAVQESDAIIDKLAALKALGVTISIDDFGTEYSSLSRLTRLPIDRVKMAMPFVQGIDSGSRGQAVVNVIINLARTLGLAVIAEGVETDVQLAFLRSMRCDEAQGYFFFRPMPAEEVEGCLLVPA